MLIAIQKQIAQHPLCDLLLMVIRLGFAKVRCFTVESYALRASLISLKVMIYNAISMFAVVWVYDKIPDFA